MRKIAIRAEFEAGEPRIFASRAQLVKRSAQYHPLDGQLVPRSSDAGLLAAIFAGEVPSCTDAEWLSDKNKRGMYTLGDGSTNIRLPDWNGKSSGSLGALVVRGDGVNSDNPGSIQGDCIRNIEGNAYPVRGNGQWIAVGGYGGAMKPASGGVQAVVLNASGEDINHTGGILFDASLVVPTGPENRMINTSGVHAVKR